MHFIFFNLQALDNVIPHGILFKPFDILASKDL